MDKKIKNPSGRGGPRPGAGRKKSGYNYKTKSIPAELEPQINEAINFLKTLDKQGIFEKSATIQFSFDPETSMATAGLIPEPDEQAKYYTIAEIQSIKDQIIQIAQASKKNFVRIHQIREKIGVDPDLFDTALRELEKEQRIQLNVGDPSTLTEQQKRNSYTDPDDRKKRLRITLVLVED